MIIIHVQVKIKPEKRDEFLDIAHQEAAHARTLKGCIRYEWMGDVKDGNTFTVYEEWATQADFDAYRNSDDFKQLNDIFAPLMAAAPDSHYYNAEPISA
jgi:quinol monooxygenase YgiN